MPSQVGVDAFATAVAPTIRQTQAASAKSLREIVATLNGSRRRWRIFFVALGKGVGAGSVRCNQAKRNLLGLIVRQRIDLSPFKPRR